MTAADHISVSLWVLPNPSTAAAASGLAGMSANMAARCRSFSSPIYARDGRVPEGLSTNSQKPVGF
ncbi:hypothetical protein PMJ10TS2_79290 (plasmid) [Paenibacillus melissococcoides]